MKNTHNTHTTVTTRNQETAQKIVDKICALIDEGNPLPWIKPWSTDGKYAVKIVDGEKIVTVPATAVNRRGQPYRGANVYLPAGEYVTYAQCHAEGGRIKKGATGWTVVYWTFYEKQATDEDGKPMVNEETGEPIMKRVPCLKYYVVFNVKDCEGIEQKHFPKPTEVRIPITHTEYVERDNSAKRNDEAEAVIADYVGRAGNGFQVFCDKESDSAYYSPAQDFVRVPCIGQYETGSEYYSTMFHELGHSTGHQTRLDRKQAMAACFGSQEYSREELVAESTAATILAALGMDDANTFRNSAAYIKSWASAIKKDPMMYVTAASRAQAAVDMILGLPTEIETGV